MARKILLALSLCWGLLPTPEAFAQGRSGFWLRFNFGFGFASIQADNTLLGDLAISSNPLSGVGSVALGAFVGDRLVLFGEFAADVLADPKVKLGGEEWSVEGFTATAGGVGAGVQYYLAPTWFLAGSLYISEVTFEFENVEVSTDPAFGIRLLVGKDWPVSRVIALGIAADGLFVSGANNNDGDTWDSVGLGLTFSFTWVPKGIK